MRDEVALLTAIWNAAGSNRNRISGCPNFLHRYSDVYFCVYFSLPSWQYFKECPCGLLKLKAFFFHNYRDRYFISFLCVFFICIFARFSWFSLSLLFTVGPFCVFHYPDRSSSFLCVFFHLYCDKILAVFVVAYDSRTILTEFIFLSFPFCAFLR